jgi:aminopeptidase N|eukprot:COSAG03_NODE_274_length_9561_cov_13.502114_12_plen_309_part_00
MSSAAGGRSMLRTVRRLGVVHQLLQQRGPRWVVNTRPASTSAEPVEKFRKDYAAPPFTVPAVDLCFVLGVGEQPTAVTCTLAVQRSPSALPDSALRLDGENIVLHSVDVDGRLLARGTDFEVDESCLTILPHAIPCSSTFSVKTHSETKPHENFQLSGLYKSSGMFCTQCEAEGFRRIAYHYDRPDIMAKYKVRIEADAAENPVLLSNGNKVAEGVLPGGMHYSEWEDPWPKPSYLFALVAGDLGVLRDTFTTMSGREVQLAIYSEHDKIDQCHHSMLSLKQSMEWDEQVFGLEYDLDIFNIVAVSDL